MQRCLRISLVETECKYHHVCSVRETGQDYLVAEANRLECYVEEGEGGVTGFSL